MLWTDEGVLLAVRRHGESGAIVSVFTARHGRHAGLVRGGFGRRARPVYQQGNILHVTWRARLAEQLGALTGELKVPLAARLMADPARLAGLAAACALLETTLPERDPHPDLYATLCAFLEQLAAGLRLTGVFLRRHLFDASDRPMPEARDRLLARLARSTEP